MKLVAIAAALAALLGVTIYRSVRAACRKAPARRPWLVAAALVALGLVGGLAPSIGRLKPPWSESPSGLLLIGVRILGLGAMAVAALATLLAVAGARDRE
jgi:hypothetical protein